jgi:hypothetical protein
MEQVRWVRVRAAAEEWAVVKDKGKGKGKDNGEDREILVCQE